MLLLSILHFLISTIFSRFNVFLFHVLCQASMAPKIEEVQKEPGVKIEAPTAAEACAGMRYDAS